MKSLHFDVSRYSWHLSYSSYVLESSQELCPSNILEHISYLNIQNKFWAIRLFSWSHCSFWTGSASETFEGLTPEIDMFRTLWCFEVCNWQGSYCYQLLLVILLIQAGRQEKLKNTLVLKSWWPQSIIMLLVCSVFRSLGCSLFTFLLTGRLDRKLILNVD